MKRRWLAGSASGYAGKPCTDGNYTEVRLKDEGMAGQMEGNMTILEEKVLAAIDLIKSLRADLARLRAERDDLALRLDDVTEENVDLKRELGQVRRTVTDTERFEVKRRAIEEKVGGLLEMLEGIG